MQRRRELGLRLRLRARVRLSFDMLARDLRCVSQVTAREDVRAYPHLTVSWPALLLSDQLNDFITSCWERSSAKKGVVCYVASVGRRPALRLVLEEV